MSYSKNRAIVLAVTEGAMTTSQAATHFDTSPRHIRRLLAQYRQHGLKGLEPKSGKPHHNPNATNQQTINQIIKLRHKLQNEGLDNGPQSIWNHLPNENRPSPTTIWRILKRANLITPQPQKRPKNSYHRFQADLPNQTWQSDFTHVQLKNGTDTEVITWLDDHSRYLLHVSAHPHITCQTVVQTFTQTAKIHDLPASTLTDNAMVYTTRLARGNNTRNNQPNAFEQLLDELNITQKNGAPAHPTTQGKIERYHQTLKKWLNAQPPATNLNDLNTLLKDFQHIYNTKRPHRALNRKTPNQAYHNKPKAHPTITINKNDWRVRLDTVDQSGTITLRYHGKLTHLGIGRAHKNNPVIALIHGPHTIIINKNTGEIIAEHTINPNKTYQPKNGQMS